ncbi:MAG: hypothetical protein PVG07_01430, partial [Acidobacteriota bacterium]
NAVKTLTLVLACLALLAVTGAPPARAATPDAVATPDANPELSAPATPLPLNPTDGALDMSLSCSDQGKEYTTFVNEPDPGPCMDYCANNGWTFIGYIELGRGYYVCTCCSD